MVGEWACPGRVDPRGGLETAAHNLLECFQSRVDVLQVLGGHAAHRLFVLKPPPEPDPNHKEDRYPEDRHDQQRFLIGEDLYDPVIHISLLTCNYRRSTFPAALFLENDRP